MKRIVFAGWFLIVLTLLSCSRKKAPEPAVTENSGSQLSLAEVDIIDKMPQTEDSTQEKEVFEAEETRLGTEVLSYLEDEANFSSPIIEDTEPASVLEEDTSVPQVESVEKRLLDAYNRLKVMEYDTELFIPVTKENSSVLVHYSNNSAIRLFYDELYRLTKKEYWKMDSVENAKITGTETYSYKDEAKKPFEKTIEKEDSIFVSKFNENGLVIRTEKYAVEDSAKGKLLQTTFWTYDDKNRITSETLTEKNLVKKQVFDYSKTDGQVKSTKVKNKDDSSQDNKNEASDEELPPDYEYYENGVLITKTEYIKKGGYSTTIWFDSINSVRTDYENYIKIRDVYFTNGVERRVKNYE